MTWAAACGRGRATPAAVTPAATPATGRAACSACPSCGRVGAACVSWSGTVTRVQTGGPASGDAPAGSASAVGAASAPAASRRTLRSLDCGATRPAGSGGGRGRGRGWGRGAGYRLCSSTLNGVATPPCQTSSRTAIHDLFFVLLKLLMYYLLIIR